MTSPSYSDLLVLQSAFENCILLRTIIYEIYGWINIIIILLYTFYFLNIYILKTLRYSREHSIITYIEIMCAKIAYIYLYIRSLVIYTYKIIRTYNITIRVANRPSLVRTVLRILWCMSCDLYLTTVRQIYPAISSPRDSLLSRPRRFLLYILRESRNSIDVIKYARAYGIILWSRNYEFLFIFFFKLKLDVLRISWFFLGNRRGPWTYNSESGRNGFIEFK